MFIVLEGNEGSGKSTQARYLHKWFTEYLGYRPDQVLLTRQPGGTEAGRLIRNVLYESYVNLHPQTEALLLEADRVQHVEGLIRPFLMNGGVVISDRYTPSAYAYQGFGHQIPLSKVVSRFRESTGGLIPDLTIILDVSVQTTLRRIQARGGTLNSNDQKDAKFYERVRKGYLEWARIHKTETLSYIESYTGVIDGEESIDLVWGNIRDLVSAWKRQERQLRVLMGKRDPIERYGKK